MKPYKHRKLTSTPDVAEIKEEGRASHVGKLPEKSGEFKPIIRSAKNKKSTRRYLKRADKAKELRNLKDME